MPVPALDGLRPTTDRTKETLFNWLMHDVQDAVCLDAFAGSGGLGFEALSRYARFTTFIEKDAKVAQGIKDNISTLQASAEVVNADTVKAIAGLTEQYSLVFIDPPFGYDLVEPTLRGLLDTGRLAQDALVYVEQEADKPLPDFAAMSFSQLKFKKTGQLQYALLRYTGN